MTMPVSILNLEDAEIRVPGRKTGLTEPLLRRMSLRVRSGETLAITGRSGSGKSTLLYGLGLLLPFDSGRYEVDGVSAQGLSRSAAARLRGRSIGFVFQDAALISELDAARNVMLPLNYGDVKDGSERRLRAEESLAHVGLDGFGHRNVQSLSGGEQQRVAIARALVHRPKLVLADEPTGALDPQTASEIIDVLLRSMEHAHASLVVVTHDPVVAARMQRRIHIEGGEIRELDTGAYRSEASS